MLYCADNFITQVPHKEKFALIRDLYHDMCILQQVYVPKGFIDLSLQGLVQYCRLVPVIPCPNNVSVTVII